MNILHLRQELVQHCVTPATVFSFHCFGSFCILVVGGMWCARPLLRYKCGCISALSATCSNIPVAGVCIRRARASTMLVIVHFLPSASHRLRHSSKPRHNKRHSHKHRHPNRNKYPPCYRWAWNGHRQTTTNTSTAKVAALPTNDRCQRNKCGHH